MKKSFIVLLVLTLFLTILGPGAAMRADDDQLVIGMASDILSMNPFRYDEGPTNQFMRHIFDTLVQVDADRKFQPWLAESFEQSEDGLTWTFHLRKDVKFHDGAPLTTEDVIASFEHASNPDSPSAFSIYLTSIDKIEAPDDTTLVFHLKQVDTIFLFEVSNIYIRRAEHITGKTEQELQENPIGTGMYRFVEQVKEDHIDVSYNEDFWGEEPDFKNVRFRPISNAATRTATMLSGDLDIMMDVPVRDMDRISNTDGIELIQMKGLRQIYLNCDCREDSPHFEGTANPMADPRVREALFLSIDREAIITKVMNGHAYLMNSVIPEGYVGYEEYEMPEYNPERAKELLAEAGYPDGFEVTLDAPNDRYVNDGQIAQAVAGFFEKIGVKVNLNLMPKSNFFSHISVRENNTMLLMTGWADSSVEGISFLKDMVHTYAKEQNYGSVNRGHFSAEEVDALIEKGLSEPDEAKRAEIVKEAWKLAAPLYALLPLHYEEDSYAVKDSLEYAARFDKMIYAWDFHRK